MHARTHFWWVTQNAPKALLDVMRCDSVCVMSPHFARIYGGRDLSDLWLTPGRHRIHRQTSPCQRPVHAADQEQTADEERAESE